MIQLLPQLTSCRPIYPCALLKAPRGVRYAQACVVNVFTLARVMHLGADTQTTIVGS